MKHEAEIYILACLDCGELFHTKKTDRIVCSGCAYDAPNLRGMGLLLGELCALIQLQPELVDHVKSGTVPSGVEKKPGWWRHFLLEAYIQHQMDPLREREDRINAPIRNATEE